MGFNSAFKGLKVKKNIRHSLIGHTVRRNEFVVNILEGAITGKKAVGRPRLRHLKQVAMNTEADSCTAMKRLACNSSRREAAKPIKRLKNNKKKIYCATYRTKFLLPAVAVLLVCN